MSDVPRLWPHDTPPEMRRLIERVCTPRQVDVLKLKAHGYGRRRIATILGIAPSSVSDRLRHASDRIQEALSEREAA